MKECRQNRPLHNFIFIVYKLLIPFVELHKAVQSGSHAKLASLMPIFLELFIVTKKVKYARLIVIWLHMLETLDPAWSVANS